MQVEDIQKSFIPVRDYAIKHQITVQAVYKMIKTGRIQSTKIGTYTLVRDL